MLIVTGYFNCPLQQDPPCIGSHDPRFDHALQSDKHYFQQMIRDLSVIVVHCKQKYLPIFLHGNHQIRIDFVFMRSNQIRWKHLSASIDCRFERIGLHQGPQYRPLLLSIPRWHPVRKASSTLQTIDRFRIRQEIIMDTTSWRQFAKETQSCILRQQASCTRNPVDNCHSMEQELRQLYLECFPRQKRQYTTDMTVKSLTARMWHARKQARMIYYIQVRTLFHSWQ